MDKDLLDKLYEIFASTNKTNMFSRLSFDRRMKSKSTSNALLNLEEVLNNIFRNEFSSKVITEEELSVIYLRLCETYNEKELQHHLRKYVPSKGTSFGAFDTQSKEQEIDDSNDEKVENLINAIECLKDRIGIKKTIKDYGVDEETFLSSLDEMSEQAFDDQCTGANPRYPKISEIKEMYLRAYYGK